MNRPLENLHDESVLRFVENGSMDSPPVRAIDSSE